MVKLRIAPLKGHEAFPKVFKKSRKFTGKDAVLFVQFGSPDTVEIGEDLFKTVFVGVTIRKKTARKAVMRNRVKRLLRVAFQNVLKEIFNEYSQPDAPFPFKAFIAVWQAVPEQPKQLQLEHVEPVIRQLITQAQLHATEYFSQDRRGSHTSP